jgi:hypothetical protein
MCNYRFQAYILMLLVILKMTNISQQEMNQNMIDTCLEMMTISDNLSLIQQLNDCVANACNNCIE